jgi:dTDP-4-amino-4,6-dideoxygalactose transaminase
MKVPFLDIQPQYESLKTQINAAIQEVIESAAFAGGPFVERFEEDFASYCGSRYAIGVGSGTEALWLALLGVGVGAGDEVITVPSTFMATCEAITYCGARPVFVDIDERTYTMDPSLLESAISQKTKAIIPVHLFGQPADMDPINEIARRHGLAVIEDACQAHGAKYFGRRAGSLGDAGCFSFYPGKNLGAFGEAGAVITNNATLEAKLRTLRDHGQVRKYHHTMVGWNCRMDGIQAAVLRVKLMQLDRCNELRRMHATAYDRALGQCEAIVTPRRSAASEHAFHIYAIRMQERDGIMRTMAEHGIGSGIHYPVPVHLQPAYRSLGYESGAFPIAERCAQEFLSLPMFPELTDPQISCVCQVLMEAAKVEAAA